MYNIERDTRRDAQGPPMATTQTLNKEICRGRGDFTSRDRMCLLDLEWQKIETNLLETNTPEALPHQDNPHTCPLYIHVQKAFRQWLYRARESKGSLDIPDVPGATA